MMTPEKKELIQKNSQRILKELDERQEKVSHPSHYNHFKIEPIDYILANSLSFCEGNIVKYVSRHSFKGGKDDVFKAIQYCLFILKDTYNITKEELNDTLEKWKI